VATKAAIDRPMVFASSLMAAERQICDLTQFANRIQANSPTLIKILPDRPAGAS